MGKKVKYVFNHKTLSFEHARLTARHYILKVLSYLIHQCCFYCGYRGYWHLFLRFSERKNAEEGIRQYELQFKLINERLDKLQVVLNDMADRDDNIYRVIFESEPIPTEARKAGMAGADRYKDLEGYRNSDILVQTAKKLDQITAKMYVQTKSFDEVYEMAINKSRLHCQYTCHSTRQQPGPAPPCHPTLAIARILIIKSSKFHEGVDFSAPPGTEIYATGDGVVIASDRSKSGYGNQIIIDHGFGYKTMYAHLQSFKVRAG